MSQRDKFENWLVTGIENRWISEVVCETHDGLPWNENEMIRWQEGDDFCVPAVRVYGLEFVDESEQQ